MRGPPPMLPCSLVRLSGPKIVAISGDITWLASESIRPVNAAPMVKPSARSSMLPPSAKDLNRLQIFLRGADDGMPNGDTAPTIGRAPPQATARFHTGRSQAIRDLGIGTSLSDQGFHRGGELGQALLGVREVHAGLRVGVQLVVDAGVPLT